MRWPVKWFPFHAALCLTSLISLSAAAAAMAADIAPGDVRFDDAAVAGRVSDHVGNAEAGKKAFVNRGLGNCLACHAVSTLSDELFHGDVGPSLDGAAGRWSAAQLRAIVVNAKQVFGPDTVMPGFYTLDVGTGVAKAFKGKTILTAEQVEDVVAFLGTLK